ncbi:MAG: SUMF1/EgtB/PvdO family nonheme iron enzyme [Verrucomicrobiota bacterium]|jgi:hypothetical protein
MAAEADRVVRGGSWNNDDRANLLSSYRNNDEPDERNDNIGFRVVLGVEGSARKVPSGWRDVVRGEGPCAAGAKRRPNLRGHALVDPGKRRGARRGR